MLFIETSVFTKLLPEYLSDEEYRKLQCCLLETPKAVEIIIGSGGVREIRWAPDGAGKSGGVRVVYYCKHFKDEIWMLTIYSKSERDTIPGYMLKSIAEAIKRE